MKKGDLIAELDPKELEASLAAANANGRACKRR